MRLGVELFERTNGGTRPTIAGREFPLTAARIVAETDSAFRKLQTRGRGENGHLSIGIYASFSTGNMYATLVEHHHKFPEVEVHTVDGDHDQLTYALTNNTIDIAIMTSLRSVWDDRALSLWSERVIVAVHEGHRLARKEIVYWADLAGENVLVPHLGPGRELERLLSSKVDNYGTQHLLHQESALDRPTSQYGEC